jgi:hypothetical protein
VDADAVASGAPCENSAAPCRGEADGKLDGGRLAFDCSPPKTVASGFVWIEARRDAARDPDTDPEREDLPMTVADGLGIDCSGSGGGRVAAISDIFGPISEFGPLLSSSDVALDRAVTIPCESSSSETSTTVGCIRASED